MERYKVSVRVWPYSTGKGRENDQKLCGPEYQTFEVRAPSDFRIAVAAAEVLVQGIKSNPAVWQANITGVELI